MRRTLLASLLVALTMLSFLLPQAARAQSRMDVKRSILLVNQEIELLKATVEANFASVEDAQATAEAQQVRLAELEQELAGLKARLAKMDMAEREQSLALDTLRQEVDEKLSRFSLDGKLRFRGVYEANRTDFDSEAEDKDLYLTQRLRLNLGLRVAEKVHIHTQIQDARIWGANKGAVAAERSELSFNQAYVHVDELVRGLSLDAGRMILDYGQGRMIGADDWSSTGNSFDGLRLRYSPFEGMQLDALYAVVHERDIFDGDDATLSGLYGSWELLEGFFTEAYVLHLYDGLEASYTNVATIGLAAHGVLFGHLYADLEGAVQVGRAAEVQTLHENDHLATAGYAEIGYTDPKGPVPFRAGLFASGASGDAEPRDVPGNDASVSFIPLFPSSHLYWGAMDQVTWTNIRNFGLRGEISPMPDMRIDLQIHELYAADDGAALPGIGLTSSVPLEAMGSHLGHEVDLRVALRPAKWVAIDFGYSVFLPEEGGKNYKGLDEANAAHWLWLQTGLLF